MLRKALLSCGVVASALYVGIDLLAAVLHPEYHSFSTRAVSELMAAGAPTERLVDPLLVFYDALMIAFGVGVWRAAQGRGTRVVAGILIAYAAFGVLGPTVFEMDVKTGANPALTVADWLHIAATGVLVVLIFVAVTVGALTRGRAFRIYSFATLAVMLVSGVLSGVMAGKPGFGLFERLDIGAFLAWVAVLAVALLRDQSAGFSSTMIPQRSQLNRAGQPLSPSGTFTAS